MVAVGRGAQSGVLIKNAEARERREGVPHVSGRQNRHAEQGQPSVAAIKPAPGIEAARLLRLAASLQRHCEHPLGAAIVRAAERRRLQGGARVGKGITGPIAGPPDPGRSHAGRCRHRGAEADRRWPPPMSAWPRRGDRRRHRETGHLSHRRDFGGIVRARRLSAATTTNIRPNVSFSFVSSAARIPACGRPGPSRARPAALSNAAARRPLSRTETEGRQAGVAAARMPLKPGRH
jgi:hypothetical protein